MAWKVHGKGGNVARPGSHRLNPGNTEHPRMRPSSSRVPRAELERNKSVLIQTLPRTHGETEAR